MKNLNLFMFLALFLINMSCSEKEEPINDEEASEIVKDIDGNEYEVLNLLGRKWLRQDLKTSRYRDGTVIPRVEDSEEWESMSEGAYTWYNNDPKNDKEFGKIYNGYAIICCEICPDGWRLPTENEIRIVSGYFARYYDLQQYPMVPEWMNLEGLIGGERNPNGEFVNERKFIAADNDEFVANSSLKWNSHENKPQTENPSAYKVERILSIYGAVYQFHGFSGFFTKYAANTGGYIKCIQDE